MTEFDLDYRTGFYGRTGCRRLLMRDRPGHILSVRALHADIESGIQERFIGLNRRIARYIGNGDRFGRRFLTLGEA